MSVGTALVTGSAGFVGRHMVRELELQGWEVHPVDLLDPRMPLDARMLFLGPVETRQYDLVVHAAAQAPHRAAIDGQPRTHLYNAALDAMMFDWAVRTRQRRVIYFSSSAVYPIGYQRGAPPYRLNEADAFGVGGMSRISSGLLEIMQERMVDLQPDANYGRTKLAGEQLAESTRAAGVPVHVVRPFSGYGTDQGEDWPFGAFLARAMRREQPFPLWNPQAVRDWVHIDDVVATTLDMVDLDHPGPINLCTGRGVSTIDLAAMICQYAGVRTTFEPDGTAPQGVAYRVGDPSRMSTVRSAMVSLEEGVQRAVLHGQREVGRGQ
jgi:nucleoside-diphosphate-sugar epimerase